MTSTYEQCDIGPVSASTTHASIHGCKDCQEQEGYTCNETAADQPSICFEECGDGFVTVGEECDLGSSIDPVIDAESIDGCSSCKINDFFDCSYDSEA